MQGKINKINSSKPVNINISFTINPKNIMNQSISHSAPRRLRDTLHARSLAKPPTPDLLAATERPLEMPTDIKPRRNRKHNSIDGCVLQEPQKINQPSTDFKKLMETVYTRKQVSKTKRKSDFSGKKTHSKTASKMSAFENSGLRSVMFENSTKLQLKKDLKRSGKQSINKIVTAELSKKSLPITIPAQASKSARKKKSKKVKSGQQSENLIKSSEQQQLYNQKIIEKLTSLRSMNNTLFHSEVEEDQLYHRGTIIVHTDQSMDCIDEIHNIEIQRKYQNLDRKDAEPDQRVKAYETRNLIQTYIEILNENHQKIETEGKQSQGIAEQFEQYREIYEKNRIKDNDESEDSQNSEHSISQLEVEEVSSNKEGIEGKKKKIKDQSEKLRPFCSSEMTKEQKLINELERIKLHDLKKHEVQKWGELLTFIKESVENGQNNTEEILKNVYKFLQRTKEDLQRELSNSPNKDKEKEKQKTFEEFTNKLSSDQKNKNASERQSPVADMEKNQFEDISSMSFKDEDYEEDNEELKLMNLEMIENALKARHEVLLERREKELRSLEEQKICGKIGDEQWQAEVARIEKWTKKETGEILQARKNLWRGYNQAKGIIEKTLKSRQFQEESAKKKGMMKCLSEDYLLKSNYKNLLKKVEDEEDSEEPQSPESSEKSQEVEDEENEENVENVENEANQSGEEQVQSQSSQSHSLHHDKETIELREIGEMENMETIKERLLDIKQRHLKEDEQLSNNDKQYEEVIENRILSEQVQNGDVSYEEVDNMLQESYEDEEMKIIQKELGKGLEPLSEKILEDERLKHLLPEDKEDIFEFIFLDLSIELYQEPCTDNCIMEAINKHISSIKRQAMKKKGVKTNLNVVKEYLKRFTGFISRAHKPCLKTLDEPVGPTAIEMLRYMHENDEEPREDEEVQTTLVIPSTVFDEFEKQLLPSIQFQVYYENDEERENKRIEFLKNVLHIHNKALFDALNEYLDLLRPFGLWGKPFPWKKTPAFIHATDHQNKQDRLQKASNKVIEYCSYVCGLLVDKEESLVGNARLSEDYLEQIKEDRLSRMLATDLMDNQERWLFYDDEETEVLVEISNAVYSIIMKEMASEVMQFQRF